MVQIDSKIFTMLIKTDIKANERMIDYMKDVIEKESSFEVRQAMRQDLKELELINNNLKAEMN
jgi:hypothetical protein